VSALGADSPPHLGLARETARLRELAAVFVRLGLIAFGGPAVHIAMMEDEAVVRRQWLTRERFLDLLGVTNLLPGPSSSEMAIYLGYLRGRVGRARHLLWVSHFDGGASSLHPAAGPPPFRMP
jgi:chromate transporter